MLAVPRLFDWRAGFPDPAAALDEPNGLLAIGGGLDVDWLITAYASGAFPWFESDAQPVLWWSPDPRAVVAPDAIKVSRSLRKRVRNGGFTVTADCCFEQVVDGCRSGRDGGTWITANMRNAYVELHRAGYAHSIEVHLHDELVGGLYGVSLGAMFFGESMFSRVRDASKVAFCHLAAALCAWDFTLIDCQLPNDHLRSLGVGEMSRTRFLRMLRENTDVPTRRGAWQLPAASAALADPRRTATLPPARAVTRESRPDA